MLVIEIMVIEITETVTVMIILKSNTENEKLNRDSVNNNKKRKFSIIMTMEIMMMRSNNETKVR